MFKKIGKDSFGQMLEWIDLLCNRKSISPEDRGFTCTFTFLLSRFSWPHFTLCLELFKSHFNKRGDRFEL
jgi:hypothetical protein